MNVDANGDIAELPQPFSIAREKFSGRYGAGMNRCGNTAIKIFLPSSWNGQGIDGAFVMDSFYYFKEKKKVVQYMVELLDFIQQKTGHVFMAVCGGGAKISPRSGDIKFADLLELVPRGVKIVIAIICGNDFWAKNYTIQPVDESMKTELRAFCNGMSNRARNVLAVVGGSASLWGYPKWMHACMQYQFNVDADIF